MKVLVYFVSTTFNIQQQHTTVTSLSAPEKYIKHDFIHVCGIFADIHTETGVKRWYDAI